MYISEDFKNSFQKLALSLITVLSLKILFFHEFDWLILCFWKAKQYQNVCPERPENFRETSCFTSWILTQIDIERSRGNVMTFNNCFPRQIFKAESRELPLRMEKDTQTTRKEP